MAVPTRHVTRVSPTVDKWILRTPTQHRQLLTSTDPKIICDKINTACSSAYGIKALYATSTMVKNVVIAFDYKSKPTDIKAASGTIISTLVPGSEGATFSKNVSLGAEGVLPSG